MISVNRRTLYGEVFNDVRCLSSDEKPTDGIKNGSTLIEIDTGKRYLYDALSGSWNEFSQGGGGEYVLPTMSQSVKGGATVGDGLTMDGTALSVDYSEVASVDALEGATALSPTGGIVSTQDGLAISPVTTAKLADGAVTDEKLAQSGGVLEKVDSIAFFEASANLFDKTSVIPNKTLAAGSGKTYNSLSDSDTYSVSPIIPVEPNTSYTGSAILTGNSARIFAYNESGVYVGGIDGTRNADGSYTYAMVHIVKFVRFRYTTGFLNIDSYMFVKGTSIPGTYIPYGKVLTGGVLLDVKNELSSDIDAVDDRINSLDEQLNIRSVLWRVPNTIDDDGFVNAAYVNGNTGQLISRPSEPTLWCSDYTELVGGATYYYYGIYPSGHMAFYDADNNYINGYEKATIPNPFTAPLEAKYVRFLVVSSSATLPKNSWLNIINEAPDETEVKYAFNAETALAVNVNNPCDYDGNEITVFNKIICIGDSITQGTFNHNEGGSMQYVVDARYSYPTYLTKMCGVETFNDGIGGYTSVQWWNARRTADFSGYDCAIINLGINDALQSVSASDTTTAINSIISALRSANNGIKIFLATVVPAYSDGTPQFDTVNATIKSIASNTNCYLIDLSRYSHARKATVSEAGHLTAWGYYRLAKDYIAAISHVMSQNRSAFKFIQFIGTDYSYTR